MLDGWLDIEVIAGVLSCITYSCEVHEHRNSWLVNWQRVVVGSVVQHWRQSIVCVSAQLNWCVFKSFLKDRVVIFLHRYSEICLLLSEIIAFCPSAKHMNSDWFNSVARNIKSFFASVKLDPRWHFWRLLTQLKPICRLFRRNMAIVGNFIVVAFV